MPLSCAHSCSKVVLGMQILHLEATVKEAGPTWGMKALPRHLRRYWLAQDATQMHLQRNQSIRHLTELVPRPPPPLVPGCRRAASHNSYIHKRRTNVKLQKRRAEADEVGSLRSWCSKACSDFWKSAPADNFSGTTLAKSQLRLGRHHQARHESGANSEWAADHN